ncbi:hypothetical protein GCM10008083_31430 [Ulvibacter litoralis]|nr:hypothetical protein GCM10008083_31430 [Ulvibacter litoralis]
MVAANHTKFGGKYTKEKTVKKDFTVNKDALLKVQNSYGNIDIVTWTENRIAIEVQIKTNSDNEAKAQQKLDEISISFSGSPSQVTAVTEFNKKKSTSWSFWGDSNNNNVAMEINYIIKMPISNLVNLSNDYGAISIDKLEGTAIIKCDYGQLILGELRGENNLLTFDYTSKSSIGYMKSGKINADYSGFTLEKAGTVDLIADYTQSEIIKARDITFNCDYGKIEIGEAVHIDGRGDYVTNRIGTVSGSLQLNADYGSIKVERLTETAKNVNIIGDYTGIKLGFAPNYHFNFLVELSYASLNEDASVTILNSINEHSTKRYSGFHGKKDSGNTIKITSDYGGVTFTEK